MITPMSSGFPMGICLIQRILASSLSFIKLNWERARHVVVVFRLQVMRDVAATYMAACRAIHVAAAANAAHFNGGGCGDGMAVLSGCPGGALLHLSLAEAQAAVVVAPPGCNGGHKVAEAVIVRVDSPASEGVTFGRIVAVSLAAAASDLQVCVAGCGGLSSPALTCGQAAVSGWIIRARQLSASPRSMVEHWPVGRYHSAPVATPMRFCRPNMKTYTDLRVEADGVAAAFGTAMEPVLAQLAKAFKQRVIPPQPHLVQPNGQLAQPQHPASAGGSGATSSPSGLPPWDNIRYVWRGGIMVMIRGLNAVVAASSLELPITAHDPRVAVSAATLGLKVSSGRVDVTGTALAVLAFARGPGRGPGEPLVTVPLLSLPMLKTFLHTTFKQRSPTPYAFPRHSTAPKEGTVQDPVDVPGLMRSTSWSLALEISLVRDAVAHLMTNAPAAVSSITSTAVGGTSTIPVLSTQMLWPSGLQPQLLPSPPPGQQPYQTGSGLTPRQQLVPVTALAMVGSEGLARAYIGELQVKFLMGMVNELASGAPVMTRGSWKRCTYFDHLRPRPRPPTTAAAAGTGDSPHMHGPRPQQPATAAGDGGGGGVSLGTLLSRVDIDLSADVFDIMHDAQDPDDPSDLVCLRACNLRYANSFSYSSAVRIAMYSNGVMRTRLAPRPVMTALSVEAYDIRISMPSAAASSLTGAGGGVAHPPTTTATAASGLRRRHGIGGVAHTASSEAVPTSGTSDGAIPAAGPGFGAGLIATCDCLLLRQAAPAGGPVPGAGPWAAGEVAELDSRTVPGQQPQSQPSRPIRIVVQDVQVLCTTDSRDAVIATTVHLIQAFSRLHGSTAGRAAASASAAAAAAVSSRGCMAVTKGPVTRPQAPGTLGGKNPKARQGERKSLSGNAAGIGGGEGMSGAGAAVLDGKQAVLGHQQQVPPRTSLVLPLRPGSSLRPDTDPLTGPEIDPRVMAEERALVALLRQQNETRRAAARRRRLERSSASTASTVAATDPDQAISLDSDSVEDDGLLGSTLDPSDAPDRDADVESEPAPSGGATTAGKAAAGLHSADQHHTMLTQYEVEFVRVQVGLISEYGGGGACLVLGADCAVLRGGKAPAAAPVASTTTAAGMTATTTGALKVLTFDVETLQAYAARQDQPKEGVVPGLAATGGAAVGSSNAQAGSCGNGVRPSFSPLTDALAASAAATAAATAAAAAVGGGAGAFPQRPVEITATAPGGGSGTAAPAPVIWLQVVNGQLVPNCTVLPADRAVVAGIGGDSDAAAAGDGPTSGSGFTGSESHGSRAIMQKILNPFGMHLISSRPLIPNPGPADAPLTLPSPGASAQLPQPHSPPQLQRLHAPGGKTGANDSGGAGSSSGLKLDIDVPAITGQMESWQFQLLLGVINETLAAPFPKVVMLSSGFDGQPLPAVESAPDVAVTADMLLTLKQQLRSMQYESLTLANYLTHGSVGFHDPYHALSAPGAALALNTPPPLHHLTQSDTAAAGSGAPPAMPFAGAYTATLFKPVGQPLAAARGTGGSSGSGNAATAAAGAARSGAPDSSAAVPSVVLAQALLAPRPPGLNAEQLSALLRRNQELLLHWVLEQVSGAQDSLEAVSAVLVQLRNEVSAALEAQQHQRRKQATAVAVRLGRFGWALINRAGAPFVQAELKGLSFHHSLDRDHTGTTKIVMHAADMWELR
ncbi:hypothetical protein Vretifemale_15344, partial [Volvox reticuliferus]